MQTLEQIIYTPEYVLDQTARKIMQDHGFTPWMVRRILPFHAWPIMTKAVKPLCTLRDMDFEENEWGIFWNDLLSTEGRTGVFVCENVTLDKNIQWPNRRRYSNQGEMRSLNIMVSRQLSEHIARGEQVVVTEDDVQMWFYVVQTMQWGA